MRLARLVTLVVLVVFPAQLSAAFHFMSIKEVYGGSTSAPNARYVMLQMYFGGQTVVQGHSVIFYGATGVEITRFTFAGNVANGADQATILIATAEVQPAFGVTPDLIMTAAALTPAGGKVCFDEIDCFAWGNYTGSSTGVGAAFNPAGGIPSGQAARRRMDISGSPTNLDIGDDTQDSANDFRFAVPFPINNGGGASFLNATTTSLGATPNPSDAGQVVTFTATVTSDGATGSVIFRDGGTVLGEVDLAGTTATFMTSALAAGSHPITAVYQGDADFNTSFDTVTQVVNAGVFGAPAMFAATATSATSVALTWSAVSGATGYEVFRSPTRTGTYILAAMTTGATSTVDGLPVTADTTYLYKVRALGSGPPSDFSAIDVATTTIFEDAALTGVPVKATHVQQLRTAVGAMRAAAELLPAGTTDGSLAGVAIKAVHITELRDALDAARSAITLGAIGYTDPTITPGSTTVKADHVLQLRAGTQ